MLKGLIALFTTGVIFNPAVSLGGLLGILAYVFFDGAQLKIIYTHYQLYLLFFIFSAIYVYFLRPIFKDNGRDTDWKATITSMIKETILMSFCFVMGMLLASFFDFSDFDMKPKEQDYQYSELGSIMSLEKQAESLMQNENNQIQKILQSQ